MILRLDEGSGDSAMKAEAGKPALLAYWWLPIAEHIILKKTWNIIPSLLM